MLDLEMIDAETLLINLLGQVEYIIEDILPIGLHLFCGVSKVGKSWLNSLRYVCNLVKYRIKEAKKKLENLLGKELE